MQWIRKMKFKKTKRNIDLYTYSVIDDTAIVLKAQAIAKQYKVNLHSIKCDIFDDFEIEIGSKTKAQFIDYITALCEELKGYIERIEF